MSADIVQAQYEQLEQIAARFAAAAETQQALLQRVNQRVDVLRQGGWQGKGVAAFLREMDGEVGPAEQRLIDSLMTASDATRQISMTVRQAEVEAASLFQSGGLAEQSSDDLLNSDTNHAAPGLRHPTEKVELNSAADLYNAIADDDAPPIRILRIGDGIDGRGEYVVLIKGTIGGMEGFTTESPRSWYANVRSGVGISTEYTQAIRDAVAQAGIPEGATIHWAGHSQGGHNAQILAKIYHDEGIYRVGSVTAFGAYQMVSLPGTFPVKTYLFPTDPLNAVNLLYDRAVSSTPFPTARLLLGESVARAHTDDIILEFDRHHDYGRSQTMQNTRLPFSSSQGEVVYIPDQYSSPKRKDLLHQVAEDMWESAGHATTAIMSPLSGFSL